MKILDWYDVIWRPIYPLRRSLGISANKEELNLPLKNTKPSRYLIDYQGDRMISSKSRELTKVFEAMLAARSHSFFINCSCDFRNADALIERIAWPYDNVSFGATVENQDDFDRKVKKLQETGVKRIFIEFENMKERINILKPDQKIDFAVIGSFFRGDLKDKSLSLFFDVIRQCHEGRISFFFGGW